MNKNRSHVKSAKKWISRYKMIDCSRPSLLGEAYRHFVLSYRYDRRVARKT